MKSNFNKKRRMLSGRSNQHPGGRSPCTKAKYLNVITSQAPEGGTGCRSVGRESKKAPDDNFLSASLEL
jgi:hypothetical protein